jgi:hypothetical protein
MGFTFRKTIKLGPININLSKKGVGVSIGTGTLRLSTGTRGTQVSAGAKGITYRKSISKVISKILKRG